MPDETRRVSSRVTVLGPQRRPTLDRVVRSLGVEGPYATVTAGWQEREADDGELDALLGGRSVNLGLHARWLDVVERDREYAVAELEHRAVLEELQQLYSVQLESALGAVRTLGERVGDRPRAKAAALADAEAVVRVVDGHHLARVREAHRSFYAAWRLEEREVIVEHREALRRILQQSAALVVAGGHVGVLVQLLHLFHVAPHLPATVVAWSAGAMALTDRVVLYHDRAAQGAPHDEVYDQGLGLVPGAVLLPHARRRLRTDDALRMAVLARRFAPARCVVLDDGVRVDLTDDGALPAGARVVGTDGHVVAL
ncbi:MAG TPA: Type 1 glutamine amidotransferase-like domain-containing protein [Mycobacteriales bacterium]|jgi:hypothetical protein|nr:Type 1 glutamine amidotransferase-like domain-containing protein [Mycobacteriales bacterium]